MKYSIFHLIHLLSVFALVGTVVFAIAKPEQLVRKKVLMYSGISSLVVLITGFGLLGVMKLGVPPWSLVKVAVWLALSLLAGIAFRRPDKGSLFLWVCSVGVALALVMVSLKPI